MTDQSVQVYDFEPFYEGETCYAANLTLTINGTLPFNAGDVISFYWYTDDTGATIETTPKTATMPTSPGVSITINRISR